ncbi:MAG: exosortase/archaeosortase family protein [Planctomycetota bacterium]
MSTVASNKSGNPGAQASGGADVAARMSPLTAVAWLLVGGGFVALYGQWFLRQHNHSWNAMEDWGHAYFVPGIAAFLLWRSRDRIRKLSFEPMWAGLPAVALGIAGYFFFTFTAAANHMLQGFSMILCIFGAVLTAGGPSLMRISFLPIAFLTLGVTVSQRIMQAITEPLQDIAARGTFVLLNVLGAVFDFSATIEGNNLELFDAAGQFIAPLNVAEACSGMRMLIAFIALAAAVAVLSCPKWWQRVLLLLLATPLAIGMNIVRVATLGLLSFVDPKLAAGDAHTLIGTILLVPSLGAFMGTVWLLKKAAPGETEVSS